MKLGMLILPIIELMILHLLVSLFMSPIPVIIWCIVSITSFIISALAFGALHKVDPSGLAKVIKKHKEERQNNKGILPSQIILLWRQFLYAVYVMYFFAHIPVIILLLLTMFCFQEFLNIKVNKYVNQ